MRKIFITALLIVFGFLLATTSCAKRGTIYGGAKDTIAPKIIGSSPENFKTNFKGKEIKIVFDELIKVKNINKQLIISPPMEKQPIIVPQGSASKYISIKILDELLENTTYSFNFGQSITDNNEGNPYSQFKYIFSTGNYIDSLTVVGKIKDAYERKADNFVSVMLYDAKTYTDSTVYKETPIYVTNTLDSLKLFSLENLKEGEYQIIALKDKNGNNKFDPKSDKIGFLNEPIKIPTETVFELELFKEKTPSKIEKPIQQSTNKYFLPIEGAVEDLKITLQQGQNNFPVKLAKLPSSKSDSIQLFIPNKIENDSLSFLVERKGFSKTYKLKHKEIKETDSLSVSENTRGILNFREIYNLTTTTPLSKIDESKISVLNKDSMAVAFKANYEDFEQKITIDFKKEEEQKYQLTFLPGAFTDMYENTNDTLVKTIATKSYGDYGNLRVTLKNVDRFPIILELLDSKGVVLASQTSDNKNVLDFDLINPLIYTLRIIYDDNKNGIWDTGDFLSKTIAEQIIYMVEDVDVRANWDVNQEFDVGN